MWWALFFILLVAAAYGTTNVQSNQLRGALGAVIAAAFLWGLQRFLITQANKTRDNKLNFFDLIVTSEDNRWSLSRFQIYIWTVWVVIAFAQVAFATFSFPIIPENLAILMGINGTTAVLSTAITDPQKHAKVDNPNFFKDIFLDAEGTLDLPRTQMFIWTLVIFAIHIIIFWKGYLSSNSKPTIPEVSGGLLILMGVSNGAYLGVKAATEKK
jgi:hypothetical protein